MQWLNLKQLNIKSHASVRQSWAFDFKDSGPCLPENCDYSGLEHKTAPGQIDKEELLTTVIFKPFKDRKTTSGSSDMHSQATAYAKLAESTALNSGYESCPSAYVLNGLTDESGLTVLPVSAESAGLLPNRRDNAKGSDIVLEAILEADVARNAKDFFAQPRNQIKSE